ncbi:MAG: CRISPR-associated ring nuclease, partial [Hyphomicrobiales bacterium]
DALADVNSQDDAALMGDLILRLMLGFVQDADTQVHVSLAGGRKTMSAHALLALTLVGRPADEASHVLVSPVEFEDHPDFWHPDQGGLLNRKEELRHAPLPEPSLDPRRAAVTLVPTPTPLMRYEVKDLRALEQLRLKDVVDELNLAARLQASPRLRLDTARNAIDACGVERTLGAKLFAVYRLLAIAKKENWQGVGPDGEGPEHAGWLSVPQICVAQAPSGISIAELLLAFVREAVVAEGGDPQDHESVLEWETVTIEGRPGKKLDFAEAAIGSNTRLIDALKNAFGASAGAMLAPAIEKKRRWKSDRLNPDGSIRIEGATRFGLRLPGQAIEIV